MSLVKIILTVAFGRGRKLALSLGSPGSSYFSLFQGIAYISQCFLVFHMRFMAQPISIYILWGRAHA